MTLTEKQIAEAKSILAQRAGMKGGTARAKSLTKEQRCEIARKAGLASGKVKRARKKQKPI